jgi:peroxiredoxin
VLEQGDEAPDFELPGTDGETYTLADFDGYEAILVVFTCNHCPYAVAKMPVLNDIAADYDEVAVVGINPNDEEAYPDDSFEKMVEFVESGEVQYEAYLRDESQSVAQAYGAVCTPDPYLFENENGSFRLAYHGRLDDALNPDDEPTTEEMRAVIDRVLAGDPVEQTFKPSRGCTIKWRDGNEPDYWDDL